MKLLARQRNVWQNEAPLLIIKRQKTSSCLFLSSSVAIFCSTKNPQRLTMFLFHWVTAARSYILLLLHTSWPPALPQQGKAQLPSISHKFPLGSPVNLPHVKRNLAAALRYSKLEWEDWVHTALCLEGGRLQRGYNSSAVRGGLAKRVLDHTALFLRAIRSCDSAFLLSTWPLDYCMLFSCVYIE